MGIASSVVASAARARRASLSGRAGIEDHDDDYDQDHAEGDDEMVVATTINMMPNTMTMIATSKTMTIT